MIGISYGAGLEGDEGSDISGVSMVSGVLCYSKSNIWNSGGVAFLKSIIPSLK